MNGDFPYPKYVPGAHWPLDVQLLRFGAFSWTLEDANCHTLCVGQSGTGKTSAVLRRFARAMLKNNVGFGALILCSKPDERQTWLNWAAELDRSEEVCVFAPGQHRFDFLRFLTTHENPNVRDTLNVVECLEKMLKPVLGNTRGTASEEEFWKGQRRLLLENLLIVATNCGERITFALLASIGDNAPEDLDAVNGGAWRHSVFGRCLRQAELRTAGTPKASQVQQAKEYFLKKAPGYPSNTKGCVVMAVQGMLNCFLNPTAEAMTSGMDFTPEEALAGRILIIDCPDNLVGRMLALGVKELFQKAAMRRSAGHADAHIQPTLFCCDEFQNWITTEDAGFLAQARSSRVCCLCLTQNVPGMIAAVGGSTPQASVDALTGNFATKVFLANTDPTTTKWMSEMIGKSLLFNVSSPGTQQQFGLFARPQFSVSQQRDTDIHPDDFLHLRTGGHRNDGEVDAIVLLGAKGVQAIGRPWERVIFTQYDRQPTQQGPGPTKPGLASLKSWWGQAARRLAQGVRMLL
jgi:type IV secretory pathway TraG/TraD family ATPase VirD4